MSRMSLTHSLNHGTVGQLRHPEHSDMQGMADIIQRLHQNFILDLLPLEALDYVSRKVCKEITREEGNGRGR